MTQTTEQTSGALQTANANSSQQSSSVTALAAVKDVIRLSPEAESEADRIAKSLDISDPLSIQTIDQDGQKALAGFNAKVLERAKVSDVDDSGQLIMQVVSLAKGFDTTKIGDEKGVGAAIGRLFGRARNEVTVFKARFETVAKQFEVIEKALNDNTEKVKLDFTEMGKLAQLTLGEFRRLEVTIVGCERRLEQARTIERPALAARAEGVIRVATELNAFDDGLRRLEKKIDDMRRMRFACIQTEIIISRIRSNALGIIESSADTIYTAIEQWKQGFTIALTLDNQKKAIAFTKSVNDMANEQRKRNAALLQEATLAVAEANERSAIDYDALEFTNRTLIETAQGEARIHSEGAARRQEEKAKILALERELVELVNQQAGQQDDMKRLEA